MGKAVDFCLNAVFMCHKLPERSFSYKGKPFPICARCTGMGVGYIMAVIFLISSGLLPIGWTLLLLFPMALDGGGQLFRKWRSNNFRRFVSGALGGVGIVNLYLYVMHQSVLLGQRLFYEIFS